MAGHCRDQGQASGGSSGLHAQKNFRLSEGFNLPDQQQVHLSMLDIVNNTFSYQIRQGSLYSLFDVLVSHS